jgi:hypothetical protein
MESPQQQEPRPDIKDSFTYQTVTVHTDYPRIATYRLHTNWQPFNHEVQTTIIRIIYIDTITAYMHVPQLDGTAVDLNTTLQTPLGSFDFILTQLALNLKLEQTRNLAVNVLSSTIYPGAPIQPIKPPDSKPPDPEEIGTIKTRLTSIENRLGRFEELASDVPQLQKTIDELTLKVRDVISLQNQIARIEQYYRQTNTLLEQIRKDYPNQFTQLSKRLDDLEKSNADLHARARSDLTALTKTTEVIQKDLANQSTTLTKRISDYERSNNTVVTKLRTDLTDLVGEMTGLSNSSNNNFKILNDKLTTQSKLISDLSAKIDNVPTPTNLDKLIKDVKELGDLLAAQIKYAQDNFRMVGQCLVNRSKWHNHINDLTVYRICNTIAYFHQYGNFNRPKEVAVTQFLCDHLKDASWATILAFDTNSCMETAQELYRSMHFELQPGRYDLIPLDLSDPLLPRAPVPDTYPKPHSDPGPYDLRILSITRAQARLSFIATIGLLRHKRIDTVDCTFEVVNRYLKASQIQERDRVGPGQAIIYPILAFNHVADETLIQNILAANVTS